MTNRNKTNFRDTFRASLLGIQAVPDPIQIFSTFQWFTLDNISDYLVRYDHESAQFMPALAQSWTIDDQTISIQLKPNLKFHDGTSLTSSDVLASFERIISLKQSTHFDIWNYISDLKYIDANRFSFSYTGSKESLFLFLSSPEASVWSKADLVKEPFKPNRFSGAYFVSEISEDGLKLSKNTYSIKSAEFANSPSKVEIFGKLTRLQSFEAIKSGNVDAFIGDYIPFSSLFESHDNLRFLHTIPVVFIHLLKLTDASKNPFSAQNLNSLWTLQDQNGLLKPATSILPPGMEGALSAFETKSEIELGHAPPPGKINVGASRSYFDSKFVTAFTDNLAKSGVEVEFHSLDSTEFFNALEHPLDSGLDFLLVGYVASDKFPFTQLKLLTGPRNIEIKAPPDSAPTELKLSSLKDYQKTFLRDQILVPLYYVPSVTVFQADLDLGSQPTTDAELQFWRINENFKKPIP